MLSTRWIDADGSWERGWLLDDPSGGAFLCIGQIPYSFGGGLWSESSCTLRKYDSDARGHQI